MRGGKLSDDMSEEDASSASDDAFTVGINEYGGMKIGKEVSKANGGGELFGIEFNVGEVFGESEKVNGLFKVTSGNYVGKKEVKGGIG